MKAFIRDRDWPVPDRADLIQEHPRSSRDRLNWSKASSEARSPSCIVSSRTRATPGPSPSLISAASHTTISACCRARPAQESPELASYLQPLRQIARRGFALNVSTDLSYFAGIIPCGLQQVRMTSIERLTGRAPALARDRRRRRPALRRGVRPRAGRRPFRRPRGTLGER